MRMIHLVILLLFYNSLPSDSFAMRSKFNSVNKSKMIRYESLKAMPNFDVAVLQPTIKAIRSVPNNPQAVIYSGLAGLVVFTIYWVRKIFWIPSRPYDQKTNTVAKEYDAWSSEGILEAYWGEHIHLGYYNDDEMKKGYLKKDFVKAKYDFIDKMAEFGGIDLNLKTPIKVLDVGCGIGGTSRYLADKLGNSSSVTGITLSPFQVKRATELTKQRGLTNVHFEVMDALNMTFSDNSFDVVWACESGEHMPDKKKYVEEMVRVLKPGGHIVIATWCERDSRVKRFSSDERKMLNFLYAEWSHPLFISIQRYAEIMQGTGLLDNIKTDNWVKQTIASWWHSIWVGVFNPWPVIKRPLLWYKTFRDGLTIGRMHQSFSSGLMEYGMMTAVKVTPPV